MFENLPDFSKFQKLYHEKLKEEEAKKKQETDEAPQEKWKMKFSKDERKLEAKANAKPQFGFNYDSEDEEDAVRNLQSKSQSTSSQNERQSPPKDQKLAEVAPAAPVVVARPVVLDKFGNFRLADPTQAAVKPPDSTTLNNRRSRSRSYRRHSRSRSDSRFDIFIYLHFKLINEQIFRSPRRRRRSYSRSYSRSRSRSRERRGFRGGRGDFSRHRRFSPKRGPTSSRGGRWNDFNRGGRDRFKNDRFPRKFGGGGGRYNRSYSRSPERSPDRRHDKSDDRKSREFPDSMTEEHSTK